MKKIILLALVALTIQAHSQDSLYNARIRFPMTDSVDNGITFGRRAVYEAMIYNQRINGISLQFRVIFLNKVNTNDLSLVKSYVKEVDIINSNYVVTATGVVVGDIARVLQLYGKPSGIVNPDSAWIKFADGRFDLTTRCIGEYDYVCSQFDNLNRLSAIIRQRGIAAAAAGKLN